LSSSRRRRNKRRERSKRAHRAALERSRLERAVEPDAPAPEYVPEAGDTPETPALDDLAEALAPTRKSVAEPPPPEPEWEWIVEPQEPDPEPSTDEPGEDPRPGETDRNGEPEHWMTLRILSSSGPVTLDAEALGILLDALESTELDDDDSSVDARLARSEKLAVAARIREHAESLAQYQPDEIDRRVLGWVIESVQHESGRMPPSVLDLSGALTR
jgi:hypothetical protein